MLCRYRELESASALDRMLYSEMMISLPELLLQKVDRTTMAVGLEGRSPLLDQELMAFAARLPDEYRINSGQTKYILRKLLKPLVPLEISNRRKQGFVAPLDIWFRGEARAFIGELLLSDMTLSRGFFRPEAIKAIMRENERGRWNQGFRIWALACFELWCRTFLDNHDPRCGPVNDFPA
jgi:asparagine synthase (glutamine-hydrolysing)